jgi:glycosyltransferase 2 family protein
MKKILQYSTGIVLALIFLYFAFKSINFSDLLISLKDANYLFLILYIFISILSHVVRAWRWKYLVDHLKEGIKLRNLFSSVMIGYMVNNFIPRGGEFARPYALGKLENISAGSALATVIVERVLDVMTLIILILFSLIFYQKLLIQNFPWLNLAITISIILSILGVIFLIILSIKTAFVVSLIQKFTSFLPKKISSKIESFLKSILEGFNIVKDSKKYLLIIFSTAILWFLYALQWYVPFFAFGMAETYSLNFVSAIILNSILAIGIMIPVPGNIGTYDAFCIQALTGLFYVNSATAAAYTTATHALGLISITAVGLYFYLRDNIKLSNIKKG